MKTARMAPGAMPDGHPGFYELLDPGIREIVRYLRKYAYQTTDSGDGVTKLAGGWTTEDGVMPFPHVAVHGEVYGLVSNARMLLRRLDVGEAEGKIPPGYRVEVTYNPADDSVVMLVSWPAPFPA